MARGKIQTNIFGVPGIIVLGLWNEINNYLTFGLYSFYIEYISKGPEIIYVPLEKSIMATYKYSEGFALLWFTFEFESVAKWLNKKKTT